MDGFGLLVGKYHSNIPPEFYNEQMDTPFIGMDENGPHLSIGKGIKEFQLSSGYKLSISFSIDPEQKAAFLTYMHRLMLIVHTSGVYRADCVTQHLEQAFIQTALTLDAFDPDTPSAPRPFPLGHAVSVEVWLNAINDILPLDQDTKDRRVLLMLANTLIVLNNNLEVSYVNYLAAVGITLDLLAKYDLSQPEQDIIKDAFDDLGAKRCMDEDIEVEFSEEVPQIVPDEGYNVWVHTLLSNAADYCGENEELVLSAKEMLTLLDATPVSLVRQAIWSALKREECHQKAMCDAVSVLYRKKRVIDMLRLGWLFVLQLRLTTISRYTCLTQVAQIRTALSKAAQLRLEEASKNEIYIAYLSECIDGSEKSCQLYANAMTLIKQQLTPRVSQQWQVRFENSYMSLLERIKNPPPTSRSIQTEEDLLLDRIRVSCVKQANQTL